MTYDPDTPRPNLYTICNARNVAAGVHCPGLIVEPLPTDDELAAIAPGDTVFILLAVSDGRSGRRWWYRPAATVSAVEYPKPDVCIIIARPVAPVPELGIHSDHVFALRRDQVAEILKPRDEASDR